MSYSRTATYARAAAIGLSRRRAPVTEAAQVTWRHDGHVRALWTFTIELD